MTPEDIEDRLYPSGYPDFSDPLVRVVKKDGECIQFRGTHADTGYAQVRQPGNKLFYLHRLMWQSVTGQPLLTKDFVDHLCRNRGCVNVAHMEIVSQRENLLRGAGLSGVNSRKTHCINGHKFDKINTYLRPDIGTRQCRQCGKDREARYKK